MQNGSIVLTRTSTLICWHVVWPDCSAVWGFQVLWSLATTNGGGLQLQMASVPSGRLCPLATANCEGIRPWPQFYEHPFGTVWSLHTGSQYRGENMRKLQGTHCWLIAIVECGTAAATGSVYHTVYTREPFKSWDFVSQQSAKHQK